MHSAFSAPGPGAAAGRRSVRLALTAIIGAGFALRMAYLLSVVRAPGFFWGDPDGYLGHALILARGPHGWHWTFDAVKYEINGQIHALPPLYSVFLSFLALFPGVPLSIQIAHVVLSTAAIGFVFALGRMVHSSATGLWAAAGYAISIPVIFNVWSSSQETIYIPLLLASFCLFAWAVTKNAPPLLFAAAGLALGWSALARSMPMFFVMPAALLHVVMARDRKAALAQAVALVAGFALIVVPYCVGLSRDLGQLTLIDSHGSIHVSAEAGANQAPGLMATAVALWRTAAAEPAQFFSDSLNRARSLLHVNGGRQLQIYVTAGSRITAVLWKIVVHLGTDVLLVTASILATFGAVLCRNSRVAALFLLWAAINLGIASLGGFGGARLRSPFEPMLLVLGAVVLAGGWRRRHPLTLAAAGAVGLGLSMLVLPQFPQSLRSWPDYGVRWDSVMERQHGLINGSAGVNIAAYDAVGRMIVQSPSHELIRLEVRSGRNRLRTVAVDGREQRVSWPWPDRGLAFVGLEATEIRTGAPGALRISINPR